MEATVILASMEQLDEVIDTGIQTYTDHFSEIWTQKGLREYLTKHFHRVKVAEELRNSRDTEYLLLERNDMVVGLSKINYRSHIPHTAETGAELQKIYLLKGQTGSGLGKLLLNASLERAKAHHENTIWLDVLKTNSGARRFYEKNGFVVRGEQEMKTDIQEIGLYVMEREIV